MDIYCNIIKFFTVSNVEGEGALLPRVFPIAWRICYNITNKILLHCSMMNFCEK